MRDRFGRQCKDLHPLEKLGETLQENNLAMEALIEKLEETFISSPGADHERRASHSSSR